MKRTAKTIDDRRKILERKLELMEIEIITSALRSCGGRVTDVARELRMPLRTVWFKINKHEIDVWEFRKGTTQGRRKMTDCHYCHTKGCEVCGSSGKLPVDFVAKEIRRT